MWTVGSLGGDRKGLNQTVLPEKYMSGCREKKKERVGFPTKCTI